MVKTYSAMPGMIEYRHFVNQCLNNEELFKNFKQNNIYKNILEHVSNEIGSEYLKIIKKQTPSIIKKIDKVKINDLVGGSNLVDYKGVGHVSPSSLRYAKVLSDILVLFKKKKFKKIAEIGTGYGGQFLIFDQFLDFSNYYLFDLKEVLLFCEKYLDNYLIRNSFKTLHINNFNGEEKFDLVISNYAFSELPSELQKIYLRKVIKLSKRGYLTMNSGKKNSIFQGDFLSLNQIKKEMPFIKINYETPKDFVHQGNYVISWEK